MEQRTVESVPEPTITPIVESQPKETLEKTTTSNTSPKCHENININCKTICFPCWVGWATVTTIISLPLLFCTVLGSCGSDNYGYPTYPICLAELQCCDLMCCECTRGRW